MRRRPAEQRLAARRGASVPTWLLPVALGCLCLLGPARAADDTSGGRQIALEPRVQVAETITDNHDQSARAESDAITRLTAGLGWRGRSGSLRGFLDYALTSVVYARHNDRNELQNALNANLMADLIEDRLQLVTSAAITRSAISAFGVQPGGGGDGNANTTETRSLQITPTMRGPIGPSLRYSATLSHAIASAANAGIGDSTSTTANLHIEPTSRARLGWSLDGSHLTSDFKQGRKTQSERLFGSLRLNLDDLDMQLTATGGTERTNIISLDSARYSTWGVGALWTPSPVTRVSAEMEERFFGRSHSLSIEHRTPRTIFRLRSSRSLSTSGSEVAGDRGQAFDVINGLLASAFPDPAVREVEVSTRLRRLGWDPTRIIDTGFLLSAATLQDLLEFSAAWTGQRNTAMVLLSQGKTRRVDTLTTAFDDLSRVAQVRTSNLSVSLSHQLTPLSSLGLLLGTQRSSSGQANLFNRQTQADLQFSTRLTPDSTVGISLRRAHYNTGLQPYDETALSANYAVRF